MAQITYQSLLSEFGYVPIPNGATIEPSQIVPNKIRTKAQQQTYDAMKKLRAQRRANGFNAAGGPHGGRKFLNKKYL